MCIDSKTFDATSPEIKSPVAKPPKAIAARINALSFTRLHNRDGVGDGIGGKWWQWRPVIIGTREKKEGHVLRGRRSTFLVGLKRESRVRPSRALLLVQCAPRSYRMSQSVTATALTILRVHTRTRIHVPRTELRNTRITYFRSFFLIFFFASFL